MLVFPQEAYRNGFRQILLAFSTCHGWRVTIYASQRIQPAFSSNHYLQSNAHEPLIWGSWRTATRAGMYNA